MGLVGIYTLHLYCDHAAASDEACTDWPGIFSGHTLSTSKREARNLGWVFKPELQPSNNVLGSPYKGAAFCANHAGDIPEIKVMD